MQYEENDDLGVGSSCACDMNAKIPIQLTFVIAALALRIASAPTASLAYIALAVYALLGRAYAIQALALSWLFTMLNPGIGPEEVPFAAVGRYLVLATAAISVGLRIRSKEEAQGFRLSRPTLMTIFFGVFIVAHSLIISPIKDVSVLKALTWTVAFLTLYGAWSGLSVEERGQLERQLFGGLTALMLVSIPMLGLALGYLRTDFGFQGALNHPQAFGPVMAFLAAWLVSRILGEPRPPWQLVIYFVLTLIMIVFSGARTAGLGFILGVGVAIIFGRRSDRRQWRNVMPGLRSGRIRLMLALGFFAAIISGPFVAQSISTYLVKGTDNTTLAGAYEGSRGFLIDRMWGNIEQHPFGGIGFGIASDVQAMDISRDPTFGLPTGAAVEKGVAYIAILEELGIFGLFGMLAWMWTLLRSAARTTGIAALAVCLTTLFMNMGESTLFSPGGMGMLSLILMAWAASGIPARRRDSAYA